MKHHFTLPVFGLVLLCAVIAAFPQFSLAAEEPLAAQTIAITPEAWAERGGQKIPLQQKDKIYRSDIVLTGPTGRVQLLFEDDTVISMGADSSVSVSDFSFGEGKKPNFAASMAKGTARFVTGQIVKQNREGFTVSTPNATIGIRGTTVFVQLSPDMEKFVVEAIQGGNMVEIKDNRGGLHTLSSAGQGIILDANGATPITVEPGGLLSNNKATGGSETGGANAENADGEGNTALAGTSAFASTTPVNPLNLLDSDFLGDSNPLLANLPPLEQKVFYSGAVDSSIYPNVQGGSFSFTGDLYSNTISDARLFLHEVNPVAYANSLEAINGSGRIDSNMHYTIGDFTITSRGQGGGLVYLNAATVLMEGDISNTTSTSGSFKVVNSDGTTIADQGTYASN